MKISDLMTRSVRQIRADQSIQEAAQMMDEFDVGGLPVQGEKTGNVIGFITDRDIVVRSVSEGQNPQTTLVSEAMTQPVHFCQDDDSIENAAQFMEDKQIRRLLVKNANEEIVGLVSLSDLAMHGDNAEKTAEVLKEVSHPRRMAA